MAGPPARPPDGPRRLPILSRNDAMIATRTLHDLGQSLWLDNITRDLLESGTLARYIAELSVTGLTSNPTIFDHAIKGSADYDAAIRSKLKSGKSGEALFFELALEDVTRAADLFRPVHERTRGVDGWVSLEVSPLLARDAATTLAVAKALHASAGRPNLFIKIPGTREGLPAVEEAIFAGVPVNVTLLFSRAQYAAAADAYLRGIERRIGGEQLPQRGVAHRRVVRDERLPGGERRRRGGRHGRFPRAARARAAARAHRRKPPGNALAFPPSRQRGGSSRKRRALPPPSTMSSGSRAAASRSITSSARRRHLRSPSRSIALSPT